ncbi:beta-lactamase family protein [Sphingomonas sp. SM33]|uniref:Beta-lactamase family protein n=1 Tax=Sphingomonas telluris TaxID=2907998 RepID=A0ABS9VQ40_9SPHN|nr:serine hydrolase domain-containing protein [Sphingomonas telluris]MCH8616629.1 beta-lactamase family protein [Sphingomonas telluris]
MALSISRWAKELVSKAAVGAAGLIAVISLPLLAQTRTPQPLSPVAETARPDVAVPTSEPSLPTGRSLTADDVNAWLDGYMPYALGKGQIPGAVVVVVKDGQILTQRGYGFSDVAKQKPVDPRITLFRPGSISKLFTWTAVMQQVEQGKIDLDADVNKYLDFKIPPYQGKPITMRNIMTHTSGFEEQIKDLIVTDEKQYVPYEKLLKRWVPHRIYAPGEVPAYSNYATSLAGYIVQRVSGEQFDAYVERHILAPLGMTHSTFRQPVPANLRPFVSEGYVPGQDKPYGYEYVSSAPAGALSATGEDMGRFMIAHLQNGAGLLKPETAQLMHSPANRSIQGLHGMCLGFYEDDINGRRIIAHAGDTSAFHSDLNLFLNEGVGIYISMNSPGKEASAYSVRGTLLQEFADRYFPAAKPKPQALDSKTARENAEKLAGTWTSSRRIDSSFLSVANLFSQNKISVGKDGQLIAPVADILQARPSKWIAVGPMLWRDAYSHELLGAKLSDGKVTQISVSTIAPFTVLLPTPWYLNSAWLLPLLYLSLAVLVITMLLWPTRAIVRRRFGATLALEGRDLRAFRWSRISAVAIIAVLISWFITVSLIFKDMDLSALILLMGFLSLVAFVGGFLAMLWYALRVWQSGARWPAKVWSIALVIASATVLHIAINFHLIGFRTNF